jgi:hypothetical protein
MLRGWIEELADAMHRLVENAELQQSLGESGIARMQP